MTWTGIKRVKEFHEAFGHPVHDRPYIKDDAENSLRCRLIQEELDELLDALDERDEVGVLDALTDLSYVLFGAYVALGYGAVAEPAFQEVHASNMTKLGGNGKPQYNEHGKIMKGPNYRPPRLAYIVKYLNEKAGQKA